MLADDTLAGKPLLGPAGAYSVWVLHSTSSGQLSFSGALPLAGTASWGQPLRAGGTAGVLLSRLAGPSGFAVPPRNKTKGEVCDLKHRLARFEPSFGRTKLVSPLDPTSGKGWVHAFEPSFGRKYRIRCFSARAPKGSGKVTEENRFRSKTHDPAVGLTRMGSALWLGYLSIAPRNSRKKGRDRDAGYSPARKKTGKIVDILHNKE